MEALKELDIPAENATAVVQGFGNVGSVAANELYPARHQGDRRVGPVRRNPQSRRH